MYATLIKPCGTKYVKCYCTLSEDTRHSPVSIWAHLDPVLYDLCSIGIEIVHFVSEGPTNQYKNKDSFLLLSLLPFTKYHLSHVTWNFLEAAHGKGPADGIDAAVKNFADRKISNGCDILDCKTLFDLIKESNLNVNTSVVSSKEIDHIEALLKLQPMAKSVIGTMKIHQLIITEKGNLMHRSLSCFCKKSVPCHCHSPLQLSFKLACELPKQVHQNANPPNKQQEMETYKSNEPSTLLSLSRKRSVRERSGSTEYYQIILGYRSGYTE